jgi:phosphohistidine phosphatase SixA
MRKVLFSISVLFLLSCGTTNYYVVRHAEKQTATAGMASDVPLSAEGEQRATALGEMLKDKKVKHIYATNYIRTKSTAQPLSTILGVPVQVYDAKDSLFANELKKVKQNTLVVGHSNTVDNLINGLIGQSVLQDLPDTAYGDLFIVKRKGSKYSLERLRFGK